jgi:hypothetical protein
MNWMKKACTKRALDEEEKHGQRCMESASTHNEAKTFFGKTVLLTQPLPHSHYFVAWVDFKKTLEVRVIRSAQTWKKVSPWLEKGK